MFEGDLKDPDELEETGDEAEDEDDMDMLDEEDMDDLGTANLHSHGFGVIGEEDPEMI